MVASPTSSNTIHRQDTTGSALASGVLRLVHRLRGSLRQGFRSGSSLLDSEVDVDSELHEWQEANSGFGTANVLRRSQTLPNEDTASARRRRLERPPAQSMIVSASSLPDEDGSDSIFTECESEPATRVASLIGERVEEDPHDDGTVETRDVLEQVARALEEAKEGCGEELTCDGAACVHPPISVHTGPAPPKGRLRGAPQLPAPPPRRPAATTSSGQPRTPSSCRRACRSASNREASAKVTARKEIGFFAWPMGA